MPFMDDEKRREYMRKYMSQYRKSDTAREYDRWYRDTHKVERKEYDRLRRVARQSDRVIVGVDGEGMDVETPNGRQHIYTYLAAVTEHGDLVSEVFNPFGLRHEQCVRMLLEIPRNTLKFGYMFSYDVTKIIEGMEKVDRFMLLRPDTRKQFRCENCGKKYGLPKRPCHACGSEKRTEYIVPITFKKRKYDWFNGSFTLKEDTRRCHIWDSFRFFGTSFVEALLDWRISTEPWYCKVCKTPTPADGECQTCRANGLKALTSLTTNQIEHIYEMKQKRCQFGTESPTEIRKYCQEECHLLALMMRKVIVSHEKAGLKLRSFYGAGSTASVMLKSFGVADYKGPPMVDLHPQLQQAIACAFSGGRFENSIIGIVERPFDSYDIASAYPYAMTFLPCLKCGQWRHVKGASLMREVHNARLAVCRFEVISKITPESREDIAWMPLPFRDEKGSIYYPTGFKGWAWKPEIEAALRGWPDMVNVMEAWIYETDCQHEPFKFLPTLYRRRVEWGKEGAGKSLKLGINAGYGKTAQSKGNNPPYQSWVWAGNITSHCRAQLLDAIISAKDRWSIFALATDGISSLEKLQLPFPKNTGTFDLPKPLGVWEHKPVPQGGVTIKPGVYFPLQTTLDNVRARGVGRREVFEQRERLIEGFKAWDRKDFEEYCVPLVSRRFFGAKHCIYARSDCIRCEESWFGMPNKGCPKCGKRGDVFDVLCQKHTCNKYCDNPCPLEGREVYGLWGKRVTEVKFNPLPKREGIIGTNLEDYAPRMRIRDAGMRESAPYDLKNGDTTPEGKEARQLREFLLEQPDWDDQRYEEM